MKMYKLEISRGEVINSLDELHDFLMNCFSDLTDEGPNAELQLHKWIASVGYALLELRENETSRSK